MLKLRLNRITAILLSISVLFAGILGFSHTPSFAGANGYKDETVYFMLNHNGSLDNTIVVNSVNVKGDKVIDYGNYNNLQNLTNQISAKQEEGRIVFEGLKDGESFYYRGNLEGAKNPWDINLHYYLDGKEVKGSDLAGAKGKVKIVIKVKPSTEDIGGYSKKYILQMQVVLKSGIKGISVSGGANIVSVGSRYNVGAMFLSGFEKEVSFEVDADGFEMDSITFTGINASFEDALDIDTDAIREGIDKMNEGAINVKEGINELGAGINQAYNGLLNLSANSVPIENSGDKIKNGTDQFSGGFGQMAEKSAQIPVAITKLKSSIEEINVAMTQLTELATSLQENPDPNMAGMGKIVLQQIELNKATIKALEDMNLGVTELSATLGGISNQFSEYATGVNEYVQGVNAFAGGAKSMAYNFSPLTQAPLALSDGQQKLIDGISESKAKLNEALELVKLDPDHKILSFTAPHKNRISSVQFIMRTPEIKIPPEEKAPMPRAPKKSIWKKVLDLFKFN